MRYLLPILILLTVAVLLAIRYRRQIVTTVKVVRLIRAAMTGKPAFKEPRTESVREPNQLVQCGRCATWFDQAAATRFGRDGNYCCEACLARVA